ncbi:MAG: 50S ribosomal protein L4 [Candidatus Brennerbacteria bacterium]|nr:50S ribosomal protein L4 [Candidatus Brennerbacteria bacterium]
MTTTADIFNQAHEKVGTVELPAGLFGARWAPRTVHQVVTAFMANQRNVVAHAKGRSEVAGGGKKPWKQKHTGRARHGSRRSPLWRGGGVTHGPLTSRDFSKKVNGGMKRAALRAVLSKKMKDGEIMILDTLALPAAKTKTVAGLIRNFGANSTLFVSAKPAPALARASRNIGKVDAISAADLHAYVCVAHRTLLVEKHALEVLKKRLGK